MFIVQGSARDGGNTEQLTAIVTEGIESTTVQLRDKRLEPIVDQRHDPNGFSPIDDDMNQLVREMMEHDAIVFATPLYWYGMSGHMKTFIDRWSQCLRDDSLQFKERMKGKKAYVVIVGGPQAKMNGLALVQQFRHIFDFMGMQFEGWIIGRGSKPGDILEDTQTLAEARALNVILKAQK
ncbi:flavodoxin family protein [Paenibacillus sp. 481]|uniref:flavodoxin family protein n=1 Tax=Paenibacillus sp. 481 TaxID=2835869 RepID=UPI001E2AFDFC|nr:flavodoxin family protein [Paenibacillus sp. 481]UHA75868.1 flavodoxin family protein [Paenibacillus sp. 481]